MGKGYIIIRSLEQQSKMKPEILQALKSLFNTNKTIPIVYQRLHKPGAPLIIDSDNKIGEMTNIRKENNGDIVGDVTVYNVLKLANNFDGAIDNIAASLNAKTGKARLDAFIIYDKVAKDEIRLLKSMNANGLAKEGEIPLESSVKQEDLMAITDELMEEYRKLVASQQKSND